VLFRAIRFRTRILKFWEIGGTDFGLLNSESSKSRSGLIPAY
jgi:hypothetical protein